MNTDAKIPFALNAFGMPHRMGYLATRAGEAHPSPLDLTAFIDAAVEFGLVGVEIPLPAPEIMPIQALRETLAARGLQIVADAKGVLETDAAQLCSYLQSCAEVGATVVRSTLSRILCGDRRKLPGGWEAHLNALAERLNQVLPCAEELGLCIAVENHQDATTEDFLWLAEMVHHSPAFGVTLDTGNPLAVGQEPVDAAQKLAHLIRHLHLKDYTIHFAPEGYRLVRCAAGDGVIDFPAILDIVRGNGHAVLPGIEIGAQATRTIPLLEEGWWACYPPRQAAELLPALRVLWKQGRPCEQPYSSAWERGEDSASVAAEEWDVLCHSVDYFRTLTYGGDD